MDVWSGRPYPMGATVDRQGTNFAVFSSSAQAGAVSLCIFGEDGSEQRLPLTHHDGSVWHGYVPGVRAGQRYAFRVAGPWDPARGLWANPAKLLLDPYALAVEGVFDADPSTTTHRVGDRATPDGTDSAPHVQRSVVVDPSFDWGGDKPPGYAMSDSVIYETHVRGLTRRHPEVPEGQKGTYAGLASPPMVSHLTSLGVTAVELLPVQQFVSEPRLLHSGRSNYWGYMTIGFLAPHAAYSSSGSRGQQVAEFKAMVKVLHAAGIEVILDVVYNHTAEGDPDGPTLAFRGLDNPDYYRLDSNDPSRYVDFTGTGNTLAAGQPEVLRLIMSSLRYWVAEMHVDGFRFDLAATLARQLRDVDRFSAFLDLIYQDPVLAPVKLIAEPWDLNAPDSYELGHFPFPWGEWNDRYRGGIRDFWRGQAGAGELATRLAGSSDVFQAQELPPQASVNFVTAHDGFTLADLVAYNGKHNEANGEGNRDGTDDNRSWNCGAEGPTTDQGILDLRARQQRNFLATLFLSQGLPMIQGGDEIGRTQNGDNNAYSQDNELSWYDWQLDKARTDLKSFTGRVIAFRRAHPIFRRTSFLTGQAPRPGVGEDVVWLGPAGRPVAGGEWGAEVLGMWLNGSALTDTDLQNRLLSDDTFLLLFNTGGSPVEFALPDASRGAAWIPVLDTNVPTGEPPTAGGLAAGAQVAVPAHSLLVLRKTG